MKLKKVLLLLLIFLLTGCSATYNVTLKANSSVQENAEIKINDTEDNYSRILKLIENYNISTKNYKISRDSENIVITYNKKYNNIENYVLNSFLYKQVFNDIQVNKTVSNTTLETDANFNNNNISINKDNIINVESMKINLISDLPILKENADLKDGNKYTWIYNGNQRTKKISVTYSNTPSIMTYKSITISILIIICSLLIGTIIYRRVKQKQAI